MPTLRLVLGDQLNPDHTWFQVVDPDVCYLLMEVLQETDRVAQHIQKICGFFAAMRSFARDLEGKGHQVIYIALDDPVNLQTFAANIQTMMQHKGMTRFEYLKPDDYHLDRELKDLGRSLDIPASCLDTEHFLTAREEVKDFFAGKKQYRMESFYRAMRQKHSILMAGGKPEGGRWNFDRDNRRPYDGSVALPDPLCFDNDVSDIVSMLNKLQVSTFGTVAPKRFIWPVSPDQARALLQVFVDTLLPEFGTFEDAMTLQSWSLFHSRLSFALNTKMLHPMKVIQAALGAWERDPARTGLNNLEGFIRQVMGWREFVRGVYWAEMPEYQDLNFFGHQADLPDFYWTGDTRMRCLRECISQSLEKAYAHHIQRLMVTGNFALLAGIHPDQVDAWYLGIYIDALEWVEMPNTRGMSQFADGGILGSKPYAASANYISRMSDYCTRCSYDPKTRVGDQGCPFNALYWDFVSRHLELLRRIPRMGVILKAWERLTSGDKKSILKRAGQLKSDPP
jgi:deoxyribodipyrimidine photolyase-related protein